MMKSGFRKLSRLAWKYVVKANSGEEALKCLLAQDFAAILLDVQMPGMDGLATLQRLQENPTTQSVPVILLTAKVQPADRERFAQLGIAGVITKPFDPVQLASQVAQALGWNL